MNAKEELKKIESEMEDFCEPLMKRRRELTKIIEEEFETEQEKFFDSTIAGHLFYGDKETWSGFRDSIHLIKPISCSDFSTYNVCDVFKLEIGLHSGTGNLKSISVSNTTERVSNFKTHYKELTFENFENVKKLMSEGFAEWLLNFDFKLNTTHE